MLEAQTWRVFCAIDLSNSARERIAEHISTLRKTVPEAHASWSRQDNIHLTLKFLGNIQQSRVGSFSEAVASAVADVKPFKLGLRETGVFPTRGSPRVLWIGTEDFEGELGKLHARLEDESARVGFAKEARPFHPHLTLARLRNPEHARTLAAAHKATEFQPEEIFVSELLVIRSELSGAGSKYTLISRHPLGL